MHLAPVRLNRRYSTSSVPSLRVGGSFWHNKAIPDLIPVLPVAKHPVSSCLYLRYNRPSDCERTVPQPVKFLERSTESRRYESVPSTNLHDLSVYALICSVSLNYNELERRTLRGKRRNCVRSGISSSITLRLCYILSPRRRCRLSVL